MTWRGWRRGFAGGEEGASSSKEERLEERKRLQERGGERAAVRAGGVSVVERVVRVPEQQRGGRRYSRRRGGRRESCCEGNWLEEGVLLQEKEGGTATVRRTGCRKGVPQSGNSSGKECGAQAEGVEGEKLVKRSV